MNLILKISRQDFNSTFRDPVFKGLLLFPFVAFAAVRWALPVIVEQYPAVANYEGVILMWACLQSATMFGFIYGFLFLEEKEENVHLALQVLPQSPLKIVFARLMVGLSISTVVNFSLIRFGGIANLNLIFEGLLAFLYALVAPLIALLIGALAKNRIEGMAQMKLLNLALILPGLLYFFPMKALHATAVIPTYWLFRSMEKAGSGFGFFLFYAGGLLYLSALLFWFSGRWGKNQ